MHKVVNIVLKPEDVPGACFVHIDINKHTKPELKRWLKVRGLKHSGSKATLVER